MEVQQSEWIEGQDVATVTYRNGTVILVNRTTQAFMSYMIRPQYFFSPTVISQEPNGDQRIAFANGTVHINNAPLPSTATLYERAIAQMWFRNYSNGTTETRFVNGTQIRTFKNLTSGLDQVTFVQRVEGNVNIQVNNTISIGFSNSTQRFVYPPLPSTATEYERAINPEYKDLFLNGSSIVKFINGTVAFFNSTGSFVRYIVAP